MLCLSLLVAGLQAVQARLAPLHQGIGARLLIAALCYAQPLVRSWARYRARLYSHRAPQADPALTGDLQQRWSWTGCRSVAYWSEAGNDRTELLGRAVAFMDEHRWGKVLDSGWCDWDMAVHCESGLILKVTTVQEEHGQAQRLIRIRYRLCPTARLMVLGSIGLVTVTIGAWSTPRVAMAAAALIVGFGARAWGRGLAAASRVMALFHTQAQRLHMVSCPEEAQLSLVSEPSRQVPESASEVSGRAQTPLNPGGAEGRGAFLPVFPSVPTLKSPSPSEIEEQVT
jgi:hypothetical protein